MRSAILHAHLTLGSPAFEERAQLAAARRVAQLAKGLRLDLPDAVPVSRRRKQRAWTLGAILCEETSPTGEETTFAWLTNCAVNRDSVTAIADQVGRLRQKKNEGFNVQKNSGLNLEHVFSQNWDHAKAYYYLLQLGHLLLQLLHHNSLHLALAKQYGRKTVLTLWGALKKIPQRLLEALRYYLLPEDFPAGAASACHISLNTS